MENQHDKYYINAFLLMTPGFVNKKKKSDEREALSKVSSSACTEFEDKECSPREKKTIRWSWFVLIVIFPRQMFSVSSIR